MMGYSGYPFPGVLGSYPTFYASVEKDGDENILLIGSKPEEVEKARKALRGSEGRMRIARRGPAEHKSFAQLNDAADGAMTKDLLDGLSFESKAPASLEFSFGFPEKGKIALSLHHNLFEVFLGKADKPKSTWSLNNPGLAFGGGKPWLTGLLSVLMTEDNTLDLLASLSGGDRDTVWEFLKEQNISLKTLANAFRSFGFVLGGESSLHGRDMPGAYADFSRKNDNLVPQWS